MTALRVAVFGLGEAGSRIARDLASAGAAVVGYDPAAVPMPEGVTQVDEPAAAVADADLVLAITAAADAPTALDQALASMPTEVLYADLSTASAGLKRDLAATAASAGLAFVDVALMATVPGRGLRTPALVSGPAAERYRSMLAPFDVRIECVGTEPGEAATRKLLRSVFMKGLAAVTIEAMRAAEAADRADWLWENLVEEITAAGAPLLSRLVRGTEPHALRRLHEMEAAQALLGELGVEALMTRGTVASLRHVLDQGLPDIAVVADE